jgi:pyruvate dehydrogenase E2 component (dihydrolipoamide acetyltransferase)
MATALIMPKQGQSVESCAIVGWKKKVGDAVKTGEVLCEVETDKATFEVESPATGILLAIFHEAGAQVPVLEAIAAIGAPGEDVSGLRSASPAAGGAATPVAAIPAAAGPTATAAPSAARAEPAAPPPATPAAKATAAAGSAAASPRARALAETKGIPLDGIAGTGPGGRIIERDVLSALEGRQPLTPAAREKAASLGSASVPQAGTGIGGRVRAEDVTAGRRSAPAAATGTAAAAGPAARRAATGRFTDIPIKGVRKIVADRMLASLATTAQLTLNASAHARQLQELRRLFKESPAELGLAGVTINDLVHLAVVRTLLSHPELNATFDGTTIRRYEDVHLGFAIDTPRGLMVPVIRDANALTLRQLAAEAARLVKECREGGVKPDELTGGTFTITNLGAFGIESFTPVLNVPQVAILGVCVIRPEPVQNGDEIVFQPRIGLSLTINHQVVDGAPGARFLQALGTAIAGLPALLAE